MLFSLAGFGESEQEPPANEELICVSKTLLASRWEKSVMSFILQTTPWDQAEAVAHIFA